jgi:hypothetical protein
MSEDFLTNRGDNWRVGRRLMDKSVVGTNGEHDAETERFVRVREPASTISRMFAQNSPQCAGGMHGRVWIRQVVACFWDAICGSPAALSRICLAIRPLCVPKT